MSVRLQLEGQTVLVIGGSSGIGLETARRARAEGATVIVTAREAIRLHGVGLELGASIGAFDATDFDRLTRFFGELPRPIDHVLVSGPGPCYAATRPPEVVARDEIGMALLLPLHVARNAPGDVRDGGTLLFLGTAGAGRGEPGHSITAALRAMTKGLAAELAPIRVNLIAAASGVEPVAIAATAVRVMIDGAVTGETFEVDQ